MIACAMDFPLFVIPSRLPRRCANEDEDERRSRSPGQAPTVEVFFGDETVEIAVEAPQDPAPSDKRRFALLTVPRELFNKALGDAARRSKSQRPAILEEGR